MRDAFFEEAYELARRDRNLYVLSNDQGAPSLDRFRRDWPERFLNLGIAEQNVVSVAAGLAMAGKRPIVYGITPFVTLRCLEQWKVDVCLMGQPVLLAGVGAGYGYGPAGPTHHALEDIAAMRTLPGMTVYCPARAEDVRRLLPMQLSMDGPAYFRLDRAPLQLPAEAEPDSVGPSGARLLREGSDIALVACGVMLGRALSVAESLARLGISARVVDWYRLQPLPDAALGELLAGVTQWVTLEEHGLRGGLGSILAEWIVDLELPVRLRRIGVPESAIYGYGDREVLQRRAGLDEESILARILDRRSLVRAAPERRAV